ncbi:Catalytic LigB subunit of aromatic ring-opening dioxygenase [Saccharomonospora viridis]|uniref:Extradiol ring-cleavage dioxygenase class III enzyme subunit B domain-containing protein n=1 Tax=Saccharomonospora viridis (strain ATCC 15386 / DSM 43017 / JCM 3036 / CCUG 5913 / NBRC 12207 / NCIMB 9602 / P101) TaxID=471857 RepID=C7MVB8_SACVD|nr:hypothetical protein Svir_27660 [Saccharomonospora viridis DSM 43017]SFP44659.1 Catalytic LigB subunit of aromatic ring-opening dioxygenase [Saccharomonospora viridis]
MTLPVTSERVISCAVVVPQPPLLVPALVPGAVERTAAVRDATLAAARALAEVSKQWLAVGVGARRATIEPDTQGSFRGFGVDVPVSLSSAPTAAAPRELPLSVLVAGWLREQVGAASVRVELVAEHADVAECVTLGEQLAAAEERALLVLGDGSTRHETAPSGWPDARAEDFDARVRTALAEADHEALLAVDPALAAELQAQGRAAWQVLAGLARTRTGWRGEVLYSDAPFGVAYHVARWVGR